MLFLESSDESIIQCPLRPLIDSNSPTVYSKAPFSRSRLGEIQIELKKHRLLVGEHICMATHGNLCNFWKILISISFPLTFNLLCISLYKSSFFEKYWFQLVSHWLSIYCAYPYIKAHFLERWFCEKDENWPMRWKKIGCFLGAFPLWISSRGVLGGTQSPLAAGSVLSSVGRVEFDDFFLTILVRL